MNSTLAAYGNLMHRLRDGARRRGWLHRLEERDGWWPRHLRTLFAIYDAEDLATLDLPWWTYAAIERVENFLEHRTDAKVFEFGSGASTVWFARRGVRVHAVEHDPDFAALVRGLLESDPSAQRGAVRLEVVPGQPVSTSPAVRSQRDGFEHLDFSDYVATIERTGSTFDLITIDGRARLDALRRALPHVKDDGVILFDNIDRKRYRPALNVRGLSIEVLRGATPCVLHPTSTALLWPEQSGA